MPPGTLFRLAAISTRIEDLTENRPLLTQREVFRFYMPLALSWVFMAIESPSSIAIISRLPAGRENTAAFLVMMAIALWCESAVIDLLSTSTTLCKNRQSFVEISRFVHYILVLVTAVHLLLVFTPLYDLVTLKVMGLDPRVAALSRAGLVLMVPWSAAIGWRRYRQGILIRFNRTRLIGLGTAVRVGTCTTVGWTLFAVAPLGGTQIAAIALICSVIAEAAFIHFSSLSVIRESLSAASELRHNVGGSLASGEETELSNVASPQLLTKEDGDEPLTQNKLFRFHWPLAATTMVLLVGNPIISGALARAPQPILAQASWQVAVSLIWLCRTIVYALPEVVITLYKDAQSARVLKRFSLTVGACTTGALIAMYVLRLDLLVFTRVLGADAPSAEMGHTAFIWGALLPLIGAAQSYIRGMLTAHHLTVSRLTAILVSMSVLLLMLWLGIAARWPGVINAGVALTTAMSSELLALYISWQKGKRSLSAFA